MEETTMWQYISMPADGSIHMHLCHFAVLIRRRVANTVRVSSSNKQKTTTSYNFFSAHRSCITLTFYSDLYK